MKPTIIACIIGFINLHTALSDTIFVSTTGQDGNSGSRQEPVKTFAAAVEKIGEGDVMLILPGTYVDAIYLPESKSGSAADPITIMGTNSDSVIIDGENNLPVLFYADGPDYIHLKNITFRRAKNADAGYGGAAVRNTTGWANWKLTAGWRLTDVIIEDCCGMGMGVMNANDFEMRRCIGQRNFTSGFCIVQCTNIRSYDCIIRNNNPGWSTDPFPERTATEWPSWLVYDSTESKYFMLASHAGGGNNYVRSDSVLIDNIEVYENHGQGLWFDSHNINAIIRNSSCHHNRAYLNTPVTGCIMGGIGLFLEISFEDGSVLVENCRFYGDDYAAVGIHESQNLTFINNDVDGIISFSGYSDPAHGLDRSALQPRNVLIRNNVFRNGVVYAEKLTHYWTADTIADRNIVFEGNTWCGVYPAENILASCRYYEWGANPMAGPKMFSDLWTVETIGGENHYEYLTYLVEGLEQMREKWGTFTTDTYVEDCGVKVVSQTPAAGMLQRPIEVRFSPDTRIMYLERMNPGETNVIRVGVFNAGGRNVLEVDASTIKKNGSISCAGLRPGVYYVKINTESGTAFRRVSVVR